MRKPMVKAMACALAFTMVATTPMSASASGIAGLYSTTDEGKTATKTTTNTDGLKDDVSGNGSGSDVSGNGSGSDVSGNDVSGNGSGKDVIEHDNATGTTTITTTNTNGLDSFENGQENDKFIIGVSFDKDVVNLEAGEETELVATVFYNDGTTFKYNADKGGADADLKDLLVFRKITTSEKDQDLSAGSVAYAYDETAGGVKAIKNDTLNVRAIHGGSFYVEAALKTDKSGKYKYFDVVAVNVKEYADTITTVDEFAGYAEHTYTLEDLGLTRIPETSNDNITVTATKGYVKVNKDNSFTIQKDIKNAEVVVTAVSEKGKIATTKITTKEATPITKIDKVAPVKLGFNTWNKTTADVTLKTYVGNKVEDKDNTTTDVITWTTKNANVATVANATGKSNTIVATGAGKTVITAKATSGKSVKINVTVTADLQVITAIVDGNGNDNSEVYPGQKVELFVVKDPAQSNTKITWEVNRESKNLAKVDKNGVVTANAKNLEGTVTVTAKFTRVNENGSKTKNVYAEKAYTLTVVKSELTADKLVLDDTYKIGKRTENPDGSLKSDVIYVTKYDDYNAEAKLNNGESAKDAKGETFDTNLLNDMLTWTSSKAKVASVDGTGFTKALSAGKANVTASVVNANGRTLKAKVAVASTQVVTSLQMSKTVVNVPVDKLKAVTLKVSKQLPKNATKESLVWDIEGADSIVLTDNDAKFDGNKYVSKTASAKVSFAEDAQVGDSATITVRAANGATAKVVVNVVYPTTKVELRDEKGAAVKTTYLGVGKQLSWNLNDMATIISGKGTTAVAVKAGTEGYEKVEFSVNKSGIVTIDKDGNVYAVKAGTVKITAKTPSGKKAVMTVKVQ